MLSRKFNLNPWIAEGRKPSSEEEGIDLGVIGYTPDISLERR
jgi:hypothetical protein